MPLTDLDVGRGGEVSGHSAPQDIAIIGSGIAGLSCAWLLSTRHRVTVYEGAERTGGHANTVEVATPAGGLPIDIGFTTYDEMTSPNLTALFRHLGVPVRPSEMSFAVSVDGGRLDYAGPDWRGLFARKRNLVSRRFWGMLADLRRFHRSAACDLGQLDHEAVSLAEYLRDGGYGAALRDDYLLPMAAAIWSCSLEAAGSRLVAPFIRLCGHHGLWSGARRPAWRTVGGGSRAYVARLTEPFASRIHTNRPALSVERRDGGVHVRSAEGSHLYDHVVLACHAGQALTLLGAEATRRERSVLGGFRYNRALAVLHTDETLMPARRAVWASQNFIGGSALDRSHGDGSGGGGPGIRPFVTYWMNRMQSLSAETGYFVTVNPPRPPRPGALLRTESYDHPMPDAAAARARRQLWPLQNEGGVWFAGAYFGDGFHEDGLQAGLAVAERLGGQPRPWLVSNPSGRIQLTEPSDLCVRGTNR